MDVEGTATRVFTAEHLAAIALQTGRAKDKARLLQLMESGVIDDKAAQRRRGAARPQAAWERFERQFLSGDQ